MTNQFLAHWRDQLPDALTTFAGLASTADDVDLAADLLPAGVIWPIRDAVQEFDGDAIDAVRTVAGDNAKYLLRAVQSWDDDPLAAARALAAQAADEPALAQALADAVDYFDAANTLARQLGDNPTQIEQIQAALVNVGGIVNIGSLTLNVTQAVEIPPPPEGTPPPAVDDFVGREADLARYAEKLATGHLAVISGMAGVGKTALAAKLARHVAPADRIFWHAFHEGEGFESVVWGLAAFLARHGDDELWRMLHHARQSGSQPPPDTLFTYLVQAVRGRGFLLCFDDFQHVDEDPVLEALVDGLRGAIAAGELDVIITARRIPRFVQMTVFEPLAGLAMADAQRLFAVRGLDLPDDLAEAVHRHTGGNAQFLTLTVNVLQAAPDATAAVARLARADDLERYLLSEVDESLTGQERQVMEALAVLLGYPATRSAVEAVLGGSSILRPLRSLGDRHLLVVQEGEGERVYNQHALVQEFYYELAGAHRRRTLHQRAGAYYEEVEPDLLRAARHYERAGAFARAADLATRDVWAIINQGQAAQLRRLLQRIEPEPLPPPLCVRLFTARGRAHAHTGESQPARQAYEEAVSAAEALGDSPEAEQLTIDIYAGLGDLLVYEAPADALTWLKQGLAQIGDAAELLIITGGVQVILGNYSEALDNLERGLALLGPEGTPGPSALRGRALFNLQAAHSARGDLNEALRWGEKALENSQLLHDRWQQQNILMNLGVDQLLAGHWDEAVEMLDEALTIAESLGDPVSGTGLHGNLGIVHTNRGDDDLALHHLRKSLESARRANSQVHEAIAQFHLADLSIRQSKWDDVLSHLREAERIASELDNQTVLIDVHQAWAEIYMARSNPAQALEHAQQAHSKARELGDVRGTGIGLKLMAQALAKQERHAEAENAFGEALSLLHGVDRYEMNRTRCAWGEARIANGDVEGGRQLLTAAQATFSELGAARELAKVTELLEQIEAMQRNHP